MEHNSQAGTRGLQDLQNPQDSPRKASQRPGQSSVLDKNGCATPSLGLELQGVQCVRPAANLPGDTTDFELEIMGLQCAAEVATVFLDGVRGFVLAAK